MKKIISLLVLLVIISSNVFAANQVGESDTNCIASQSSQNRQDGKDVEEDDDKEEVKEVKVIRA